MKNITREILGIEVQISGVVETLAEAITAAGSEEAVLNDFNSNVLAHSHYTEVRKLIVKKVAELTGITRLTKKHGEKEVFAETEQQYIGRVTEQLGEDGFAQHLAAIQEAVAALQVDYKPGTRGAGAASSKPAKKWYDYVVALKKDGRFDEFVTKHNLEAETEDELDDAVALKVKQIVTEKEKAAKAAALAAL